MIDFHPLTILLGGVSMSNQPVFPDCHVAPIQVWAYLTADCQARVIRLMAQLAFNVVLAQPDVLIKEPDYAKPTHHTQNPA